MRAGVAPRDLPRVVAGVGGLTALAWFDLWRRAGAMAPGSGMAMDMAMPQPMPWSLPDFFAAGATWSVMMIAMMLPSATPMLTFLSATQRAQGAAASAAGTSLFAATFLLVWVAWSWVAAGLQWVLRAFAALSPQLTLVRAPLAAILAAVGLYQLTPLKQACLARCQSPPRFLLTRWRGGPWGALHMGGRYGAYSVGCCWALMGLLLVVGVMNLLWIAALSIYVLSEKTVLRGPWPGRVTGAVLIAWALYLVRMLLPNHQSRVRQFHASQAACAWGQRLRSFEHTS
jgi:predicted metal-binding membrane protein